MNRTTRRLLAMLRPLAPLMTVSAACRVVNQGLGVAIPALAAAGVVRVAAGDPAGALVAWLAGLAVAKGLFRYLEQFTGHAVAFRLLAELRVDTYRRIEPLAPAGLEDERSGDLVARVIGDVDRVEPFYAHTIAPLVSAVAVPLLTAAALAWWADPVVGLAFAPFPLAIALAVPWVGRARVAARSARAQALAGDAAAVFTDAVQGAREIAVLRARDQIGARVRRTGEAAAAVQAALARAAAWRVLGGEVLTGAAVAAVVLAGAGRLSPATLAAAVTAAWLGTGPARALEGIVPDLARALAAADRLFELSDRPPPVVHVTHGAARPGDGSVHLAGVSVWLGGEPALAGVDLHVASGEYVAVVGPSGSGKSTLVELLLRFRDPDRGEVLVGGADVRRVPAAELREAVALVPQRPELFWGSIAANLRLAAPGATDDELLAVLDRVALGGWARELPRGLATTVGEVGDALSGGQRQRLAVARALLRDPRVLVLDEATSELDADSERQVLGAIAAEAGRRTVLVVAHRMDTVAGADRIVVLGEGRVVESGRHEELVAAGGLYAGLWRRHEDVLA